MIRDLIHVRLRCGERNARLQAAERAHAFVHVALLEQRILELANGNKDILNAEIRGFELKTRGHHSDYGVAAAIHRDALSNDVRRRAELALPQTRADQRHRRSAQTIIVSGERPSTSRAHTQNLEEVRGNHAHTHAFGFAANPKNWGKK